MITTPNLLLQVPVVGDTSPSYAASITNSFNLLDLHDHSSGKGVPVKANTLTWAGLTVDVGQAQVQSLAVTRYTDQAAASALPAASYPRGLFTVGGDLWFNTGYGTQLQLTASGVLNGALVGGIVGSYASSGASVNYNSSTKTYNFYDQNGLYAALAVATANITACNAATLTVSNAVVATPTTTKTYRVNPLRGLWPNQGATPSFPNPPLRVSFVANFNCRWFLPLPAPNFGTITAVRIRMYANGTNVLGSCALNTTSNTSGSTNNVNIGNATWPTTASGDFLMTITPTQTATCAGNFFWVDFNGTSSSSATTAAIVSVEFDVSLAQLPDTLV